MPFTTTAASLRRLPLFFAYLPDRAGVYAKRLEVRPRHWERWAQDREEGYGEFGLGYLPPATQPPFPLPAGAPPSTPQMAGSVLIFRADSLDAAWKRIRDDVYWTHGVWDPEQARVEEFIRHEMYQD